MRSSPDPCLLRLFKDLPDVPDIEDICTLCEPLADDATVMSFPMKADRKKPREELDVVNVIEWRSNAKERYFLMVRRPKGGLLAGLYEFPTSANVSKSISRSAQNDIPYTLLHRLLISNISQDDGKDSASSLRIRSIEAAPDVLHIFSHIRKTYRPQWVVLEGGASLPLLKHENDSETHSQWVLLKDVEHSNIGTGMSKVWGVTRSRWQNIDLHTK